MRVGIVSRTATYEPFYRLGDAVELVELGSTAAGVGALTSGAIDVAATCPDSLIASAAPLRIGAGLIDRPPTRILAVPDITSLDGLRGRRIATSSYQGSVSIFLRAVLRAHGLMRDDYTEIVVGPTPWQAAALERAEVDAAMLTAPYDARLADRGLPVLADVGAELGPCAFTTLNVRAGETRSERWRAMLDALERTIAAAPSPLAYDLRLDPRSIERLIVLMRAEGIAVTRKLGDLMDESATASRSR